MPDARNLRRGLEAAAVAMLVTSLLMLHSGTGRAAGGGGAAMGNGGGFEEGGSRQRQAVEFYQKGEKLRNRGIDLLRGASGIDDSEEKMEAFRQANNEFERALRYFKKAVRKNRKFHQAYNEIGFAQRMLGNYEDALKAYDRALKLEPDFPHAIEYRGEAYMHLGRLSDARKAYMDLFGAERQLADLLLRKMKTWVTLEEKKPDSPIPAEKLEAFGSWVTERSTIADQTASLFDGEAPRTW
ncbi:MAG: tetratricopeptide repeat protein [Myxococcales bacterium]